MRDPQHTIAKCALCDASVEVVTLDSPDPEAPTLIRSGPGSIGRPWFGVVKSADDEGTITNIEIVVVCSEECAQLLLEE